MNIIKGTCGGIMFRADNLTNKHYFFGICQDGFYSLIKFINNTGTPQATDLISGDSPTIKTGLNQPNLLTVIANSGNIILYVNGQQIARVQDSDYTEGQIALFADGSYGQVFTEVMFSNAKVWIL